MAAVLDKAGKKQAHERSRYKLEIQQQPRLAYLSEASKRTGKRPLDPPPVIRLRTESADLDDEGDGPEEPEDNAAFSRLTHNLFLFATLLPEDAQTKDDEVRQARNDLVNGTLFSSLSQFRGQSCFAFPDLNVLAEGRWRFCMSLYELSISGVRFKTSVITDAFEVFSHAREVFRNFFARPVPETAPKASFSAKPTSRSSVPRKPTKKPRAASSQSFASRPVQPCYTPLAHIPYQRQRRSSAVDDADELPAQDVARNLPLGAGNFKVYPRVRPSSSSSEILNPEARAEPSADHFRLPKRRIVSAAQPYPPGHPAASAAELDQQHVRSRGKYARTSHADFRNDELETANVTRRRIPSPLPAVLAPLRAHPGQLVDLPPPTKTTSLPRRKVPLRAPTRPSGSPSSSSSSAKHLPPSPPLSNSFADLLAAAAAVEKEDARGGGVTERACVCRQPPDAPCAMDFVGSDPVPKAASSSQDGSSSLSRLLGVGKDAKVIDLEDQSPMFL
ncbi:hypothetical protein C6P46_005801 [Rhodotorula mucilaginosa]|uniref:Velvet domain-containing protein n=1 Tax=Rhodotorula mucilaginosa TaxID=5537 RepID=A0A9P7B4K7_RHOMI|nr:hypothetical protein C6P46_005801 [Rhodotorula mucilaginosa]